MDKKNIDRRSFFGKLGEIGLASAALSAFPWIEACTPRQADEQKNEYARIGVIGTGSRGCIHLMFLQQIPCARVVALCDNYEPNLLNGASYFPEAARYSDYRELLGNKEVDAVVIATPLDCHYQMTMDALDAGKHVFCEKAMAYDIEQCHRMYLKQKETGKLLFVGQQRLFDPKYLKAMSSVIAGDYGPVVAVRNYWYRNNDWRRSVPSPDLERHINWRLYREYSRGLMTELACHQLQNGMWATGMLPEKVIGTGETMYWKDGREVYDSVHAIYTFPNGVHMTFDSVISNAHYGMGEQILCKDATVDLITSRLYYEKPQRRSSIESLISDIEKGIFTNSAFAGTSWAPETASRDTGIAIVANAYESDGTREIMDAFCRMVIKGEMPDKLLDQFYYATVFSLLGDEAMLQNKEMRLDPEWYV